MSKKMIGLIMLIVSGFITAIILQLSQLSYYAYLNTAIADFNKSEYDFIDKYAISIIVICILISCALLFYDSWVKFRRRNN